jgi:uncharacterized protein (DUF3820 family)
MNIASAASHFTVRLLFAARSLIFRFMETTSIDRDDFRRLLEEISQWRMPYGKFGPKQRPPHGVWICDLPIEYLAWFKERGFPKDRLGELLSAVYDVKSHGMDALFEPMRHVHGGRSSLRPPRQKSFDFDSPPSL